MKKVSAALLILAAVTCIAAQKRSIRFSRGSCDYRATYDAKKYTLAEIRGTLKLLGSANAILLQTDAAPLSLDEVSKLDVAKLDAEYKSESAELRALAVVPTPYFQDLKNRQIESLDKAYRLSRATMLGYKTPSSLNAVDWAPECSTRFARPLIAGGNDLLAAWLAVNEDSRSRNSDPARIKRIYEEQYASPDRMRYAQLEVMAFGWWNCVNDTVYHGDDVTEQDRQFEALFTKLDHLGCDVD